MIERTIAARLRSLFTMYPVVMVSGPRQSGKTTLCRQTFPDLEYVNLERPDLRDLAIDDPRGFLRRHSNGVILDEIQRVPQLASYIQAQVDEQQPNGVFLLTGSQQHDVFETVSQSLAGRTALLRLLPFSIGEALRLHAEAEYAPGTTELRSGLEIHPGLSEGRLASRLLFTGLYPRLHHHRLEPPQALGDYFATYVERDVRQLKEIRNLALFRRFVRLCAGRVGQLLNLESLGNDAGVSRTTAREWLSVLEASFILFQLPPFHANISKRLIKTPKLYFYDVGLAAYLLGIESIDQLPTHPLRGSLFENLVVVEALKHRLNQGRRSNLSFFRTRTGHEIDLVYELAHRLVAIEIKSGETITRRFFSAFSQLGELLPEGFAGEILVHGGDAVQTRHGVEVTNPRGFIEVLSAMERRLVEQR